VAADGLYPVVLGVRVVGSFSRFFFSAFRAASSSSRFLARSFSFLLCFLHDSFHVARLLFFCNGHWSASKFEWRSLGIARASERDFIACATQNGLIHINYSVLN
jgi:hypothetical protein